MITPMNKVDTLRTMFEMANTEEQDCLDSVMRTVVESCDKEDAILLILCLRNTVIASGCDMIVKIKSLMIHVY